MNQQYNKSNIIILALIYNYICNKKVELSIYSLEIFLNALNYDLYLNTQYKKIIDEESEQDIYEYDEKESIIKFKNTDILPYSLLPIKRKYIDILPNEIIEFSLTNETLSFINVNRKQIDTKIIIEPICEAKKINVLSSDDAIIKTHKVLESKGYKNIKVGPAYPIMIEGDKGYNVNCAYSVKRTIIDIEPTIEKHQKKLKIY